MINCDCKINILSFLLVSNCGYTVMSNMQIRSTFCRTDNVRNTAGRIHQHTCRQNIGNRQIIQIHRSSRRLILDLQIVLKSKCLQFLQGRIIFKVAIGIQFCGDLNDLIGYGLFKIQLRCSRIILNGICFRYTA